MRLSGLKMLILIMISGYFLSGVFSQPSGQKLQSNRLSNDELLDSLLAAGERLAESNPDTAILLSERALHIARQVKDDDKIALAEKWMAEAFYYRNDYPKSIEHYLNSAAASYNASNDSTGFMAERLTDAAYCYQELGIYDKALELNKAALRVQQRLGNTVEISNILCNIGTNYFSRAQYSNAVNYFSKTLEIDRKSGDSSAIAVSLNNMGMVYSRWGKHRQALDFYTEALELTSNEPKKAIKLSNIGMAWYNLKDYDKALDYLHRAIAIDTKYNQTIKVGVRKNEIGAVLAAKGNYAEAIRLHTEALTIFRESGIIESQIITLSDIGDLFRKTGMFNEAEAFYNESAEIALQSHALHHLSRNYKNLFELVRDKGNHQLALDYYLKYSEIKDSIFNAETSEQISRYEILYETERHEKENQLLLLDNELKAKRQKLLILLTIGLLLVLLLTVSLYRVRSKNLKQKQLLLQQDNELSKMEIYRKEAENKLLEDNIFAEQQINRLEKEKHHAEIEVKNNELANSSLNIIKKNEIMNEIRARIKNSGNGDALHELMQFVKLNTDTDQNWYKFKFEFDQIHVGFFDRLKECFPLLTEHDTRLAAYLRINLSSGEIAGLMNVSPETVHKNRQRLRKKMNFPPGCDLASELKSI